jgi:hypothetical protein
LAVKGRKRLFICLSAVLRLKKGRPYAERTELGMRQAGAGPASPPAGAPLAALVISVKETAGQISEQVEKIKAIVKQPSPQGQAEQIETRETAVPPPVELAPRAEVTEQLSSQIESISATVERLRLLPSTEQQQRTAAIETAIQDMTELAKRIGAATKQLEKITNLGANYWAQQKG